MSGRVPAGRGVTVLEVLLAGVIMTVILGLAMLLFVRNEKTVAAGQAASTAMERARQILQKLSDEIMFARLALSDWSPDGTALRYQVPSAALPLTFGYLDASTGAFMSGWSARWRFIPQRLILENDAAVPPLLASLPRQRFPADLNADNDATDAFLAGALRREVWNGPNATFGVVRAVNEAEDVVLNAASLAGDVDGDGNPDPLFALFDAAGNPSPPLESQVRTVEIRIHVGIYDPMSNLWALRGVSRRIALRNRP